MINFVHFQGRPTVTPHLEFNAANDAEVLFKAMEGFGTDENSMIDILCFRSSLQRVEIAKVFKAVYGEDLREEIMSDTSGNFANVLTALAQSTAEFYARELRDATSGLGTDECALIEILCSLNNYEVRAVNAAFGRIFDKSLEDTLRDDTSGFFRVLMLLLLCGTRDEKMKTDEERASSDAKALRNAGIAKNGTNENEFIRVLCMRSFDQIKLIAHEYEKLTGNLLEKDIKKEFSGDIEDGLLAVLACALNTPEYLAQRLYKSMAGLGTKDRHLIRLVVTRSEIDMIDIKEIFERKYGKSLKSFVDGDTSGDYKNALFALIGENRKKTVMESIDVAKIIEVAADILASDSDDSADAEENQDSVEENQDSVEEKQDSVEQKQGN